MAKKAWPVVASFLVSIGVIAAVLMCSAVIENVSLSIIFPRPQPEHTSVIQPRFIVHIAAILIVFTPFIAFFLTIALGIWAFGRTYKRMTTVRPDE